MPCDPGPPPEAHACGLRVGGDLASAPALYGWLHARDGRARVARVLAHHAVMHALCVLPR